MQSGGKVAIQEAAEMLASGNDDGARSLCERLLRADPRNTDAMGLLAGTEMRRGNYPRAIEILKNTVALYPTDPVHRFNLGLSYMRAGMPEEAVEHFRIAIRLKPDFGEAYNRLCGTAGQLGRLEEAVTAGEAAVRLIPDSAVAQMNLATAYDTSGRAQRAFQHYQEAARLAPNHPVIQCTLGDAFAGTGDKQASEDCYREAIRLRAEYTPPYRQLARLRRCTSAEDPDFSAVHRLLGNTSVPEAERSHLHFALGKMYEDCEKYDEAFHHFSLANRIENSKHRFNRQELVDFVSGIISLYTPEFLKSHSASGDVSALPTFIVGMPRSGTTLINQIIGSHPKGLGAGELYWFGQIEHKLQVALGSSEPYPACMRQFNSETAVQLAGQYIEYIQTLAEGRQYERIVDKLPGNFLHLGLIALLFPNARIVHCRRDPLDTCLSIYCILFPGSVPFGYDLQNIGIVYREYRRLMRHWQAVIPGRLLTVDYEDLVRDQEAVSRRIIEFIGLPWDDACMDFTQSRNRVRTVSAFQVRQGIYSSAIGRWRHYERHLGPLRQVLDERPESELD